MGLSNRELATVILVVAFALAFLVIPKSRRAVLPGLVRVLRALANPKICGLFAVYFAYAALLVVVAWIAGVWDISLINETLIVVVFVGLPLLVSISEVRNGRRLVIKVVKDTVGVAALIAFYVGLVSLPLWAELIMQPLVAFFALLGVAANQKKSRATLSTVCNSIVGLSIVFLLLFTSIYVPRHWAIEDLGHEGWSFATSVWLSILLIPIVYAFAFVAQAESILAVLPILNERQPIRLRVRLALVLGLHLRTRYSSAFIGCWRQHIAETRTYRAARGVMGNFRRTVRRALEAERQRLARLKEFAGVPGTDMEGIRLDRREFAATKKALKDLHYMQMGWHRNRLGHYKEDLLDLFGNVVQGDLPADHGIALALSKDRQRWRAWRRTVGGYYFAVGGTSDLDAAWEFDGPNPPGGFPSDGLEWIDSSRADSSPEWSHNDDRLDQWGV